MTRSITRRSPRRNPAPRLSTYAWAIRAEGAVRRKRSPGDYVLFSLAADAAEQNDVHVLKFILAWAETEPREAIENHIHPSLWRSLGITPLNAEKSLRKFERDHDGWTRYVAGREDIVEAYRELVDRNEANRYR